MTDEEPSDSGKQMKCTLSPMTIRYLESLSKRGMHGKGVSKVMRSLIEEGVRQAVRDKFIPQLHDDDPGG
jgi:hypothetical protein